MSESWHPSVGRRTIVVNGQPVLMTIRFAEEGVEAVGEWGSHSISETGRTILEAESRLRQTVAVLLG